MTGLKRRITAALLSGMLVAGLLSGCGDSGETGASSTESGGAQQVADAGNGTGNAKGRFVETDIVLPEGADRIYGMGKLDDGSVIAVASAGTTAMIYKSQDMGETWNVETTFSDLANSWIQGTSVAPDGTVAMVGFFMEIDDMEEEQLLLIAPDGTKTSKPVILPPTGSDMADRNMPEQIAYDAAGNLFVMDLNYDILKADPETGVCTKAYEWSGSRPSYFGIAGNTLLLMTEDGIPCFSTADGSSLPNAAALDDIVRTDFSIVQRASESFPMAVTSGMEEGSIVYVNHNGIFYYKEGGSVSEQLVNSDLSSLGTTTDYYSIVMLDAEHILVQFINAMGEHQICRYTYDKDIPAIPEKEMNIYALEDSQALRQAVSLYQKENQNIYVRLSIGMTGKDGISAEDAISTLNTEILAGNVPDILILDGLPVESYVEKGILTDLTGVLDRIDQTDGLFPNIRAVYQKDEGCFAFPASFFLPVINGPEEAANVATLGELADYAEQLKEQQPDHAILKENKAEELLWDLYQMDSASWFDAEGALKEEELKQFLTQAKRLYDLDSYPDDSAGMHRYDGRPVGSARNDGILTGKEIITYGTAVDMIDFVGQFAACETSGTTCRAYGDGSGFVPYLMTGISSGTKAKEEAEAFVTTLFGAACSGMEGHGFPVNEAAWEAMKTNAAEKYGPDSMISIGFSMEDGTSGGYMMNTMTEENIAVIEAMLQQVKIPADTDAVIRDLVIDQGVRYLKGESSLDGAVTDLCQKINLYLAE
ncbi:MAG: hypothetical protein HFI35_09875 [Roseburia sp.]|nr:hypothetical protein [Roseburia sp.]